MSGNSSFKNLKFAKLKEAIKRRKDDYPDIPIKQVSLYKFHSKALNDVQPARRRSLLPPFYVVVFEIEGLVWPTPEESPFNPALLLTGADPNNLTPEQQEFIAFFSKQSAVSLDDHPWGSFLEKFDNVPGRGRHTGGGPFVNELGEEFNRVIKGWQPIQPITKQGKSTSTTISPVFDSPGCWMFIAIRTGEDLTEYDYLGGPVEVLYSGQEETIAGWDEKTRQHDRTDTPGKCSNEWVYITEERCKNSNLSLSVFRSRVREAADISFDYDFDNRGKKRLREGDFFSIIHKTYKKITV